MFTESKIMPVGLMLSIIGDRFEKTSFYEDCGDDSVPMITDNDVLWALFNHKTCYITVWEYRGKEEINVHFIVD